MAPTPDDRRPIRSSRDRTGHPGRSQPRPHPPARRSQPVVSELGPGALYGDDPDRLFLPPDDDLAPNRPGEALRMRLAEHPVSGSSLVFQRLLGRHPEQDEWRRRLDAESEVGAALEELGRGGWHVLHSVPLPPGREISHVLIGPGGVFCVATEHVRGAWARVDETDVRAGRGRHPLPYVRRSRQDAQRASYALTRGCGFFVQAYPVLVLVGPERIEAVAGRGGADGTGTAADAMIAGTAVPEGVGDRARRPYPEGGRAGPCDVWLAAGAREAAALGALGGVLAPAVVDRIHTVARNRRTWHPI